MKKLLILLGFTMVGAVLVYLYIFHKPHRDILGEEASHEISSNRLMKFYEQSPDSANAVYLDQVLLVEGEVVEIDNISFNMTMAPGIYCHFHSESDISTMQAGDLVKVKGRVVGFDDLFGEVRMDNCKLIR